MRRRKRKTRRYLVREYQLTLAEIDELTQRQIHDLYLSTDGDEDDAPVATSAAPFQTREATAARLAKLIGRTTGSVLEGLQWNEGPS